MSALEGWSDYRLDEIADIQGGGTPSRQVAEYFGGAIPWVTPTDLPAIGQVEILSDVRESITDAGLANSSAKLIPAGSVLFSSRASVGKIAVATQPCATNQGFANFIPRSDRVDQWFLAFLLARHTPGIVSLAGKTTFLEVPRGKLRAYRVVIPSLGEQRRIVRRIKECFSRTSEIASLRKDAISAGNQLASSLYAAIANAGEWPSKTVGEVVTRSRNGKSLRQDNENATGHVLSLSAVHDVSLDFRAKKPVVLSDAFAEQYRICDGDVFVSRSNTRELVGLSSVAVATPDDRLIYPDLLIKLEADVRQVIPRYLAYVLRTRESRRQIKERSVGTSQSMVKISGERLKEVVIPVPPIDVQKSLVERFDELHDLTAQLVCEMKSPEQEYLRDAILRKAFTGKL